MSPGEEYDRNRMLLTQTSQTDYENFVVLTFSNWRILMNAIERPSMMSLRNNW